MKIYNLIRMNLNGSWIFDVFQVFLGYRTRLNLSNPAKYSQGHKLSFYLDRSSGFCLFHGQKCIFLNSNTLRTLKSKFLFEFLENFGMSRLVRSWSIIIGGGQNSKIISKQFWTISYFLSIYSSTLNDIVGPFGVVINLKLTDSFVFENVSKWVTFNGPAIVKKSFITFPFRTLKFDALNDF